MRSEFHTFAQELEGNMGDTSTDRPRIQIQTDASLDEGAILRTIAEPAILSSGVEYFLGLQRYDAEIVKGALALLLANMKQSDDPDYDDESVAAVAATVDRLLDHMNGPQPAALTETTEVEDAIIATWMNDESTRGFQLQANGDLLETTRERIAHVWSPPTVVASKV